ncbi:MAG TPA: hypothetical protein VFX05_15230 [Casimicrobiaceae bacterium]|nr:hypothetical protein [Casimicrobiaceae bacterium]
MSQFRFAAGLAATLLVGSAAWPVHAAVLAVDIPGCANVVLSGTAPNYTISCTQTTQTCVVNANPLSPQGNTQATLSVACAPAAKSVTWAASRDCTMPSAGTSPLTATVTEAGGRSCVYTAVADGGGSGSTSVVWQGASTAPPPNAPTGCSITRTPSNGSLGTSGGAVSMTVNCTGGGTVTSWAWRKNSQSGWSTSKSPSDTLPANTSSAQVTYTYGVTACAGNACATEVQTTFSVAGSQPVGMCANYPDVVFVDLPWGGQIDTYNNGQMRPETVVVGRLQVPANAVTGAIRQGRMSWVEFSGSPINRLASLSTQPCDFRGYTPSTYPTDPTGASAPLKWGVGQTGDITFGLQGGVGSPPLVPGQTYYFNLQNRNHLNDTSSCTAALCDLRMTISTYQ